MKFSLEYFRSHFVWAPGNKRFPMLGLENRRVIVCKLQGPKGYVTSYVLLVITPIWIRLLAGFCQTLKVHIIITGRLSSFLFLSLLMINVSFVIIWTQEGTFRKSGSSLRVITQFFFSSNVLLVGHSFYFVNSALPLKVYDSRKAVVQCKPYFMLIFLHYDDVRNMFGY